MWIMFVLQYVLPLLWLFQSFYDPNYILSSELVDIPLHFDCRSAQEKVTTNLSQHHL